jgi:hypothetical protein
MKRLRFEIERRELLFAHLAANRILAPVQPTGNAQPLGRCRRRYQLNNRFIIAQRLSAPVGGDELKLKSLFIDSNLR